MISSFPALRFFNALLIFCHHKNSFDNLYLTAIGPSAVSFFFFLSGFSMSVGYGKKVLSQNFNYARLMQNRIIRVYPLHLLCLLLYIGLNYKSVVSLSMGGGNLQPFFGSKLDSEICRVFFRERRGVVSVRFDVFLCGFPFRNSTSARQDTDVCFYCAVRYVVCAVYN